ncbi:unnamed protein product [Rhodiola kirilowii]
MEVNNNLGVRGNEIGIGRGGRMPEKCPRCNSMNTKFCYYNNYSLTQPRHYCRTCRRYWTQGGVCRNVPIGGATYRRNKRAVRLVVRPRAALNPNVPHQARRRGRPIGTRTGSITVSGRSVAMAGGRGRGRIISSSSFMGADFSDQFETRVSEFRRTMSSFGPMPLLSGATANSNLSLLHEFSLNNNNNVSLGFGNFRPMPPVSDTWQQESLIMGSDPADHMFRWGLDEANGRGSSDGSGTAPPLLNDIDVMNDQQTEDVPEDTLSPPSPPSA